MRKKDVIMRHVQKKIDPSLILGGKSKGEQLREKNFGRYKLREKLRDQTRRNYYPNEPALDSNQHLLLTSLAF